LVLPQAGSRFALQANGARLREEDVHKTASAQNPADVRSAAHA
jgi:hypothetical protein